jgi:hypothetical protein
MERDLRVRRRVADIGGGDGLRLAELVDLDHPGDDRSARALPDDPGGEAGREAERAEEGEPPTARLDAG